MGYEEDLIGVGRGGIGRSGFEGMGWEQMGVVILAGLILFEAELKSITIFFFP